MWMFEGKCTALRFSLAHENRRAIGTYDGLTACPGFYLKEHAPDWYLQATGAPAELSIDCTSAARSNLAVMQRVQLAELPKRDETIDEVVSRLTDIANAPEKSHVEVHAPVDVTTEHKYPFLIRVALPQPMFDQVWSLFQFGIQHNRNWIVQLGVSEHHFPTAPLTDTTVRAFIHGRLSFTGHELNVEVRP